VSSIRISSACLQAKREAANYQADVGGLEALFLPKAETFNMLEMIEPEEAGGFIYSFRGCPLANRALRGRPTYFVKQGVWPPVGPGALAMRRKEP
jgi:hypothetical protein